MWRFCAGLAHELNWKIYDPQGDVWYTADELERPAHGVAFDWGLLRGVLTVSGTALALVCGLVWKVQGGRAGDVWFWAAATGLLTFAMARIWERLATRR